MRVARWGFLLAFFVSVSAGAIDVSLVGVIGSRALLAIDEGAPVPLAIGQSIQGVRLISVQGDQAVIDIAGRRRSLRVGQHAAANPNVMADSASGGNQLQLLADGAGHFFTTGTINGVAVRFLVDTGATLVSIGASDARRIGIDTSGGQRGRSQTANGLVEVTKVKLSSVQVGELKLHNIDALVHANDMPIILLGMSFLNRMEMQRQGSIMTLKKRF